MAKRALHQRSYVKGLTPMQIYLPIAEVSVNAFLLLGLGGLSAFCQACLASVVAF